MTERRLGLTSPRLARWLMIGGIVLGTVLRVSAVAGVRSRTPDELTYRAYAAALAQDGIPGIRAFAADYVRDTVRMYPPPSRLGYPAVAAAAMIASGRIDERPGAWLSCFASIATLGLVALIAVTFLDPWAGVVAVFLLAVFPPDLVIARRAWTEASVALLSSVLVYCALSLSADRARPWTPWLFVGTGCAFTLTKETSAIVWGLCLLWIVLRRGRASFRLVAASIAAGMGCLGILAWAVGGADVLWDIQSKFPSFHASSYYGLEYQHGPAYWLLEMFWIASPGTTVLALIGLVTVPLRGSARDRPAAIALSAFALVFLVLPFALPNWLSLRFASPAFGALCLLAGGSIRQIVREFQRRGAGWGRAAAVLAGVALTLLAVRDYRYFTRWFVRTETADLAVRMVFTTAGIEIPFSGVPPPDDGSRLDPVAAACLRESDELFRQGRFDESIAAAQRALTTAPRSAEAWNNMAAGHAGMGRWDDAIRLAEVAIRLRPGSELARDNLIWAVEERSKARAAGKDHR